jgi:hypothetical protein
LLFAVMATIVAAGAALGEAIGHLVPGGGFVHFVAECGIWLTAVAIVASPLLHAGVRERLTAVLLPN